MMAYAGTVWGLGSRSSRRTSSGQPRLMDRRAFMTMVVASVLATPLAIEAQKVYRLGILTAGPALAFEQELRKLGYIENQNIVIVRRYSGGAVEKLADLADLASEMSRSARM